MQPQTPRKIESSRYTPEPQIFATFNGIKKRRIYYNVDFTEDEEAWINTVRKALKQQKGIEILEDQVILRFYYCADFKLQKCVQKLSEYNSWYTNSTIQCLTPNTFEIFREGFIYSYGNAKDGRSFIILNLTVFQIEKFSLQYYYQAVNHAINKVLKQKIIPGYIQTYYFMIDLNEQLLSLPLGLLGEVVKTIGNTYAGVLERMMILNCTLISKWIYNRLRDFGVISEETGNKVFFYTKSDIEDGQLRKLINQDILQQKYGGLRPNIDHRRNSVYKLDEKLKVVEIVEECNNSEYFSAEDNEEYMQFKEEVCCGDGQECSIY